MIRVVLVAGTRLYREGVSYLLNRQADICVIDALPDLRDAQKRLDQLGPDVVLIDMASAESDAAAGALRLLGPTTPVVALGIADSDVEVLACAELGAVGYVTRDGSVDALVSAIHSAVRGELVCSAQVSCNLARRLATLAAKSAPQLMRARLTRRECEIAGLIQQDLSNKEIAVRLRIEVATVKNHVHNLMEKLNIHRRAEAARAIGPSALLGLAIKA